MKIKKEIIERLDGRKDVREKLIDGLKTTQPTLWRWMNQNITNGPLTTVASVRIIAKELEVSEGEILIEG